MRRIATLISFPSEWKSDISGYKKSGHIIRYDVRNGYYISAIYKLSEWNKSFLVSIKKSPGLWVPRQILDNYHHKSTEHSVDGFFQVVDSRHYLDMWRVCNLSRYSTYQPDECSLIA